MEEGSFLGYGTRIGNDTEGVLLEFVVVEEAKGLMLDDALVELEATLLDHLLRTWVAAIEDWHVVDACHLVDCIHEGNEVVFDVDILL